jgi:hypothetical protein
VYEVLHTATAEDDELRSNLIEALARDLRSVQTKVRHAFYKWASYSDLAHAVVQKLKNQPCVEGVGSKLQSLTIQPSVAAGSASCRRRAVLDVGPSALSSDKINPGCQPAQGVLPAAWSTRACRREAALTVLRVLLNREAPTPPAHGWSPLI